MVWCPKDGKYCCDDLCYGGSCLRMPGCEPMEKCDNCGGVFNYQDIQCECEPCLSEDCPICGDDYCGGDCELKAST